MLKSFLRFAAGLLFGGVFLYFALQKIDLDSVARLIGESDPYFLAALGAALTIVQLLRSERWMRTFSRHLGLRRCPVFRAFLLGNAANGFLPGRAGDLIRAAMIKREPTGMGFGLALGTVAVEKVADLFVVMGMLLVLIMTSPLPDWVRNTAWTGCVVLVSIAPALAAFSWLHRMLERHGGRSNAFPVVFLRRIGAMLHDVTQAFHVFIQGNGVAWIFFLSVLIWMLESASVYLGCRALALDLPFSAGVLTVVMLSFGTMLPAAPGFVGTYQWLTMASLGFYGIGETPAFALGVLLNFSVIAVNFASGLAAMLLMRCGKSAGSGHN